ncbi:hypothetical protein PIB30_113988, partial [Stylosanthes scabra]|nr:hypothetical protein [Stylosanthes scabra]
LLLDPLILVGSILHLIVVYYLIRFGILAEIVGLQKIRIRGGTYFVTFIDDYSRKVWAFVLKSEDQ